MSLFLLLKNARHIEPNFLHTGPQFKVHGKRGEDTQIGYVYNIVEGSKMTNLVINKNKGLKRLKND